MTSPWKARWIIVILTYGGFTYITSQFTDILLRLPVT